MSSNIFAAVVGFFTIVGAATSDVPTALVELCAVKEEATKTVPYYPK